MNNKFAAIILSIFIFFTSFSTINILAQDEIVDGVIEVTNDIDNIANHNLDTNKRESLYLYKDKNVLKSAIYGDFKYNILSDNTIEITDYIGSAKELTIPNIIDGYPVTSIGSSAFYGCESLEKIIIPEGITSIGSRAFYSCLSLNSISLPNSLTSIGEDAFYLCESLNSISIPRGIERIENYVFYGCASLETIDIPNSVTSIGEHSFESCELLKNVNIPDSVTNIEDCAFMFCSSLKSIKIPGSVISIADSAFENGDTDLFMYVDEGSYAESYCKEKLQKMVIIDNQDKRSLNYICNASSDDEVTICKYIGMESNVNIPFTIGAYNVVSIGNGAFKENELLKSVTIPNTVQSIGDFAFMGCNLLESVTIPSSVKSIGTNTFNNCNSNLILSVIKGSYAENYCMYNNVSFENYIEISSIELNCTTKTLLKGKEYALKATILPNDATNKALNWVSSNTDVVTVNEIGVIKTVGIGEAIITTRATDSSGVVADINIKVVQPVTSIKLNTKSKTLAINKTFTLKATVLPTNANNKGVYWVSSNKKVATVNSNGKITPKGVGKTTIKVTAKDGSNKYAKATITIVPAKVKGVKVKAGKKRVTISFNKTKGAKKYEIYRSTRKNKCYKKIATTKKRKYINKKLKSKQTYYYKVRAVNGKYKGEFSSVKKVRVK